MEGYEALSKDFLHFLVCEFAKQECKAGVFISGKKLAHCLY